VHVVGYVGHCSAFVPALSLTRARATARPNAASSSGMGGNKLQTGKRAQKARSRAAAVK
jgi:hypothetical protein